MAFTNLSGPRFDSLWIPRCVHTDPSAASVGWTEKKVAAASDEIESEYYRRRDLSDGLNRCCKTCCALFRAGTLNSSLDKEDWLPAVAEGRLRASVWKSSMPDWGSSSNSVASNTHSSETKATNRQFTT